LTQPKTLLKKLTIEKFRALNGLEIEFGDYITVVCGKNGTSKSSILGIAAQIFSFETDYIKNEPLLFRQIMGGLFKSQYSEHFRISEKFDPVGSMKVNIELHDGYTDQDATAKLELMKRGKLPRPVVRNNSTAGDGGNSSRNFTHPVIFLSLKRLYPIAAREKYKVKAMPYLNSHIQDFIGLTNELLNRQASMATGTVGTISSAVAFGDNYDQESVSAGEDNAGQIILALMSFRKLKEEYADYKGGLLLIDEADAGLFPTAQVNLLKILGRECRDLNLQVVMTSHSPTLIEYAYQQSKENRGRYKTIYLSDTFGYVRIMQDWSWRQIYADINTQTVAAGDINKLPKINVYFEDKEADDFFAALMYRQSIKNFIARQVVSLGCSNYLNLIDRGISEFSERSIVCLDADAAKLVRKKNSKAVVLLPGSLPPDQLIFEYLYNLPVEHDFWKNKSQFTRPVFTSLASEVIREFAIQGESVSVQERVDAYRGSEKPREIFKRFYKKPEFQKLVATVSKPYNPWMHWVDAHPEEVNEFLKEFKASLENAMKVDFAVDSAKLTALEVKLKKVS
jgi:hypothetical protein